MIKLKGLEDEEMQTIVNVFTDNGFKVLVEKQMDEPYSYPLYNVCLMAKTGGNPKPYELVEVVRCQDCKYWKITSDGFGECEIMDKQFLGKEYCNLAERKTE